MYTVVLEGLDGSGKSTQAKLLAETLRQMNTLTHGMCPVCELHEPRMLREVIFATCKQVGEVPYVNDAYISYLFGMDGYLCRKEEVDLGKTHPFSTIVRDRDTTMSQYAYHHGMGTPDEMNYVTSWTINQINCANLILFVDTAIETCLSRIQARAPEKEVVDYFEKEEKLRRIHTNYMELLNDPQKIDWMGLGKVKIVRVDGNRDIVAIQNDILRLVLENYPQ